MRLLKAVGGLAAIMLAVTFALNLMDAETRETIAANQAAFEMRVIQDLLMGTDGMPEPAVTDMGNIEDPLLGSEPGKLWRVTSTVDQPAMLVVRYTARGYVDTIQLALALRDDGTLQGLRATRHRETPGLGDAIDTDKSDWVEQFAGASLGNNPQATWRLKPDGGEFDGLTGATVTSRAVVSATRDALQWCDLNCAAWRADQPEAKP